MLRFEASELNLLIPSKPDLERDAVADAWHTAGGEVIRLDKFWCPPPIEGASAKVYGPETFALVVAKVLGLRLLEPSQDLVLSVPPTYLKRDVSVASLGSALGGRFPVFVKPLMPKQFVGKVYTDEAELQGATKGLQESESVLVSDVIEIDGEARLFLLHGRVLDAAFYEGAGDCSGAIEVGEQLASEVQLPTAVVVDLGLLAAGEWVFIEANAAWGSGLNGCQAERVLPAIGAATECAA